MAANWKLHGSISLCDSYAAKLKPSTHVDVWVFPSAVYLARLAGAISSRRIGVGAQSVYTEDEGAFTGETSAAMVAEVGGVSAIVGHSERRKLFGETDEAIAARFRASQRAGLTPVLCVGESMPERMADQAFRVIHEQVEAVLRITGAEAFDEAVIAYEPVWAIGTGMTATPSQAESIHEFIRELVASRSHGSAEQLRVLYGGSVNSNNARDLIAKPNIDGFLVGGASLNIDEFNRICDAVAG